MTGPKTNERPGTKAVLRHSRVAPNKVREVLDLIRNKPVQEAEAILRFAERDVALVVGKVLHSAIANAENNDDQEAEELYVSACFADEGTTIKRWRPRARGRATRIRKRTSHITVIVSRMPSAQLERTRARRRAEQLAQRARRVAGARRVEGDTRSRADRRAGVEPEAPEVPDTDEKAVAGDTGAEAVTGDDTVAEVVTGDDTVAVADSSEETEVELSAAEEVEVEATASEETASEATATETAGDDAGEEQ